MARGRPRKEIDRSQFEGLCKLQCTLEEIAGWFDCSEDTIERWCSREYKQKFAEIYAEKRQAGRISLRRAQFRLAEKNAAMAIFLGKNYLGQSDDPSKREREQAPEEKLSDILDTIQDALTAEDGKTDGTS